MCRHRFRRRDPPSIDATQRRQLLDRASRLALHQLADYDITPHPTRAAALTARFPQRLAERGLTVTPEQLLTDALPPPRSTFFQIQDQLDLGF